jgi:hypothetical protein
MEVGHAWVLAMIRVTMNKLGVYGKLMLEDADFSSHGSSGYHLEWVHQREPKVVEKFDQQAARLGPS